MSSRFFRTRLNGEIFKSGPVHNMKHITPISRIEWTLESLDTSGLEDECNTDDE